MTRTLKLLVVAGARPNFMKIAPLLKAFAAHNERTAESDTRLEWKLVHTGQHYDARMSDVFFTELGIPAPDINLGVGSGSHAAQTAAIMAAFEPVLLTAFASQIPTPSSVLRPPASADLPALDSQPSIPSSQLPAPISQPSTLNSQPLIPGSQLPAPISQPSILNSQPSIPGSQLPTPSSEPPMPDWVIVVGDVNSSMACTLVAAKMGIKVAHVEAGLRSFDRTMPEELNRLVTDTLADLLLTPSEDANENLKREGIPPSKICLVGNIMIDSVVSHLSNGRDRSLLDELQVKDRGFIYVTLHRPSNVDQRETLSRIVDELSAIAEQWPVIFPIHPRTRGSMKEFGLSFAKEGGVHLLDPIGYNDSLTLTQHARCVLTDSGGLQEESTFFQTPCLTLRPNTERPITVDLGSNKLTRIETLRSDFEACLQGEERRGEVPPLWDGRTAERIVEALIDQ